MTRPLLLGHRGARARKTIRENTIASFDQALADGCDGFEFDVRLTAAGEALICHDPKHGDIEIAQATTQLPDLPRLEEILARYHDRAFLDIELKVAGLEGITAKLLHEQPPSHGFVVSSFLPEVLRAMRAKDSAISLGLICESHAQLHAWNQLPVEYVIPNHTLVDSELVRRLKDAGKRVIVWTVNSAADMRRFADNGVDRSAVDGIISDDPALLCRTIR